MRIESKSDILSGNFFCHVASDSKGVKVYFLIDKDEIVYVGKTLDLGRRLREHEKEKKFTDMKFVEVDENLVDEYEATYIFYLSPKYNSVLPKSIYFCSISKSIRESISNLKGFLNEELVNIVKPRCKLHKKESLKVEARDLYYITEHENAKIRDAMCVAISAFRNELEESFKENANGK